MTLSPAIALAAVLAVLLVWGSVLVFAFTTGRIWLRAFAHGQPIPILRIVGMRFRGAPAMLIVDAYVMLRHQGVQAGIDDVEWAYLESGGGVFSTADLVAAVMRRRDS